MRQQWKHAGGVGSHRLRKHSGTQICPQKQASSGCCPPQSFPFARSFLRLELDLACRVYSYTTRTGAQFQRHRQRNHRPMVTLGHLQNAKLEVIEYEQGDSR